MLSPVSPSCLALSLSHAFCCPLFTLFCRHPLFWLDPFCPPARCRRPARPHAGGPPMAHMVGLLASLALILVGGRATSAMAPIRARNSDGWPTFHADGSSMPSWCVDSSAHAAAARHAAYAETLLSCVSIAFSCHRFASRSVLSWHSSPSRRRHSRRGVRGTRMGHRDGQFAQNPPEITSYSSRASMRWTPAP